MRTTILGHTVEYEEDAKAGVDYLLHKAEHEDVKDFFSQALIRGTVGFSDESGSKYKIALHGPVYQLSKN